MRREKRPNERFAEIFGARIHALRALADWRSGGRLDSEGESGIARFVQQAAGLDSDSPYAQFAVLLETSLHFSNWVSDIRKAQLDADRHYRAARQRLSEFTDALSPDAHQPIRDAATRLLEITDPAHVKRVPEIVAGVDLPLPLLVDVPRHVSIEHVPPDAKKTEAAQPAVVFLSFTIDQAALESRHIIEPNRLHDLHVEVRLSRWLNDATSLLVEPISVEPPATYELPTYSFVRPAGLPPYVLEGSGRLLLGVPQTILSRPLEFSYRARFEPGDASAAVEGHRCLCLQSHDPRSTPVTGYWYIDERLLRIRDIVRSHGGVPDDELGWFLQVMTVLGRTAGEALQDHLFAGDWTEGNFQKEIQRRLRSDPTIGSWLEVHAHAGGGITDLSFKGIRVELKVVPEGDARGQVTPSVVAPFFGQAAQYTRASDRRLGILCVLDSTIKTSVPAHPADDLAVEQVEGPETSTLLGVVVIRGNLARPSDLSR